MRKKLSIPFTRLERLFDSDSDSDILAKRAVLECVDSDGHFRSNFECFLPGSLEGRKFKLFNQQGGKLGGEKKKKRQAGDRTCILF